MSVATIQLTQSTACLSKAEQSVWSLTIKAVGTNMPSEIFVYQIVPASDLLPGDRFQCVASVMELREIPLVPPLQKPTPHREMMHPHKAKVAVKQFSIPFYRVDTAVFMCHDLIETQQIWDLIQADVQRLVDNFNMTQNLQTSETVIVSSE